MFRISVILFAVTASVLADDECVKLLHPGIVLQCCKALPTPSPEFLATYNVCRSLPHENSCERDMCIATKRGLIKPDGKLNMDKIKEKLEMDMTKMPDLAKDVIKKCINADISKFGSPDTCEATKLFRCMELQLVRNCPEWLNDGQCESLKDLSAECKKKYD